MGKLFKIELDAASAIYACVSCSEMGTVLHFATEEDLLSKSFHSRNGPAYLFNYCTNICLGSQEEREMTTGQHIVRDVYCICCRQCIGWQYVRAHEERERYKEGKVILERIKLVELNNNPLIDVIPLPLRMSYY